MWQRENTSENRFHMTLIIRLARSFLKKYFSTESESLKTAFLASLNWVHKISDSSLSLSEHCNILYISNQSGKSLFKGPCRWMHFAGTTSPTPTKSEATISEGDINFDTECANLGREEEARGSKICVDCYQLYRDPLILTLCRYDMWKETTQLILAT